MAGTTSVKPFTDNLSSCPCLCLNNVVANVAPRQFNMNTRDKRELDNRLRIMDLKTPFLGALHGKTMLTRVNGCWRRRHCDDKTCKRLVVVGNLGGQYEYTFNDVKKVLTNYFTFKAVDTVLTQLYEMNPPQYRWFNNFLAVKENVPKDGTRFLQILVKERQELAERVMITRLSLFGKWIKKCDHGSIYQEISDENLKLMRERLLETILWPSDDNNAAPGGQKTD